VKHKQRDDQLFLARVMLVAQQGDNKNSSGDEIANVLVNDDIAHT